MNRNTKNLYKTAPKSYFYSENYKSENTQVKSKEKEVKQ